jgi:hypothetical protein
MEHRKAADILMNLEKKYPLSDEEKKAVMTAIGMLGWSSLSRSRMKAQKSKREKNTEWE